MPQPKIMPGGEQLPQYDDEPRVDPAALTAWLARNRPRSTGPWNAADVADVLLALQVAGDATLVKNSLYRAMDRDRRDIERIGATLHRIGAIGSLLEHDGNVADTAIDGLERARAAADAEIERRRNDVP